MLLQSATASLASVHARGARPLALVGAQPVIGRARSSAAEQFLSVSHKVPVNEAADWRERGTTNAELNN
jgi:hypothetical protein